jgi:hypothetical protein
MVSGKNEYKGMGESKNFHPFPSINILENPLNNQAVKNLVPQEGIESST